MRIDVEHAHSDEGRPVGLEITAPPDDACGDYVGVAIAGTRVFFTPFQARVLAAHLMSAACVAEAAR